MGFALKLRGTAGRSALWVRETKPLDAKPSLPYPVSSGIGTGCAVSLSKRGQPGVERSPAPGVVTAATPVLWSAGGGRFALTHSSNHSTPRNLKSITGTIRHVASRRHSPPEAIRPGGQKGREAVQERQEMSPAVTTLLVSACGVLALIRAQARWDRRQAHALAAPRSQWPEDLEPCVSEDPLRVVPYVEAQDERAAEFARDPDHAERAAAWDDLRDRMFPPSQQHYWVPNGELPGPDGRWFVFLGATRTAFGFRERDAATAQAERMNRLEKRGKYAALRR